MPYIDKSGRLQQHRSLWARFVSLLTAVWNVVQLFFSTLVGQDAAQTANVRLDRRWSAASGPSDGSAPARQGDLGAVHRRNAPAVKGLYGEAPCCGR